MTDNMMSGDNAGADPEDHHSRCRVNCAFADSTDEGEECPEGHDDHECTCSEYAEPDFIDYWD